MQQIILNPQRACTTCTVLVFAEGTVLGPRSRLTLYRHTSYHPLGCCVERLRGWEEQGARILYMTSRRGTQALRIAGLLRNFHFPGYMLAARERGEAYHTLVERLMPDILIEDDCRSIGGAWQMCITRVEKTAREKIHAKAVPEFGGIDHLPQQLEELML